MPDHGALVRNRAVRLLELFFARDDSRGRMAVFARAFDGVTPDPRLPIGFFEVLPVFAAGAVDQLLAHGGVGRGRHSLSLLLATMAGLRGRQNEPDYVDLQRELDALCALPTREEEQCYLACLIAESERMARRYSLARGVDVRIEYEGVAQEAGVAVLGGELGCGD